MAARDSGDRSSRLALAQAAQAQDVNKLFTIAILLRNVRFIEIVWGIYLYADYA